MENVILVCFFAFVFVPVLVRPGHSAIAYLHLLAGGEGILLVKQGL